MSRELFELVGHDNPLGVYPASVVPIGRIRGRLVAVYACESGSEVVPLNGRLKFISHNRPIKKALKNFNHEEHRLFAINEEILEFYPIRSEALYLQTLLKRSGIRNADPFLRLSLAIGTKQPELIIQELNSCLAKLQNLPDGFVDLWYLVQYEALTKLFSSKSRLTLPGDWRELLSTKGRLSPISNTMGHRLRMRGVTSYSTDQSDFTYTSRAARVHSKPKRDRMTQSAVVTHLARTCGMSKSQVKHVLADLATLAARELKANSEFTIPALGKLIVARRRNYGIRSASFNTIEFRPGNRLKLSFALRKPII